MALCGSAAWAEPVVIAALGDSLTQGYGLPAAEGFVPQLESWLTEAGEEVQLINAGVSGDTTAGGAARVAWTLTPEVDAMIVTLGGNDFLRGIDPAVSRANLEAILREAEDKEIEVMLVGMEATTNYGPAYKEAFDAMYPELAADFGALHVESFFGGLLEEAEADRQAAFAVYMQPDGIHPNAEGVARIVDGVGPSVEALIARVD